MEKVMAKNLQNVAYQHGHIDWSFESGPFFGAEALGEGSSAARGLKSAFWFLGEEEDGPVALCIDIPPNTTGRLTGAHSHASDQVRVFLSGTFKIGNDWYKPGDVRIQEAGKIYGPEMAGPEGSRQILFFNKRSGVAADFVGTGIEPAAQGLLKLIAELSKAAA
jgi:hypothetical protein